MRTAIPSYASAVTDGLLRAFARRTVVILAMAIGVAGCPALNDEGAKQDTTTITPAMAPDSARPGGALDSIEGVPAVPRETGTAGSADTGVVQIYPSAPRRGGVIFAFAEGVASSLPRCAWKGAPLPCYSHGSGVLAVIPLTADEPAGTFTLSVDRAGGRINRQVTVADRDFGRELIFLDSTRFALLGKTSDMARDSRVIRSTLSSQTPEQLWSGRWREPIPSARSAGYGEDRFYYRASDSSRSVSVSSSARVRGAFGADTTAGAATGAPGWRHSGIDIPARRGTSVVAPAAGTVAEVGNFVLTGRTVFLDHGRGVHSAYFHLDTALVRKGDVIRQGRTIGRVGDSGLATGPHLHYGIYVHGKDVDPAAWRDMPPFVLTTTPDSAGRGAAR